MAGVVEGLAPNGAAPSPSEVSEGVDGGVARLVRGGAEKEREKNIGYRHEGCMSMGVCFFLWVLRFIQNLSIYFTSPPGGNQVDGLPLPPLATNR